MARLPILALFLLAASFFIAAPAGAQDETTKFRLEFDKAAKIGSKSKMDSLMRDNQDMGVFWILNTAELISNSPSDVLYTRFEGLSGSWKRCFETDFPSAMERFFARLDINQKRNRFTLKQKFDKVNRAQFDAIAEKDKGKLNLIADEYSSLAEGFRALGDLWMEGQCNQGTAVALEDTYHGKKADYRRIVGCYARFVEIRDELGVKDKSYKQTVPRLRSLEALGFSGGGSSGGGGGGAAAAPVGPKSAGEALSAKLTFEGFKAVKDTQRPNYYLDEHRQIWPAVVLQGTGSTGKFSRVADGPTMTRSASSKVTIDGGGVDESWPLRGKLEPVTFELGTGAAKRKWAVLCDMGREVDYYQGVTMNLGMTDTSLSLYFVPGGAMVGEVGGVKIQVVDDNFDGIYGSLPARWPHFGMVKDAYQPEFDSIRIGGAKKAQPFSEYVNLGGAGWHKLEAVNGGVELKAQPFEFKTGSVQLKAKGLKPDYYVLKGIGEDLENTYIDVSGGKKVEVPVGRWELCFGLVRKGKKMQMMKAVILPTSSMKVYDVLEGETVVVETGSPFTFDFEYEAGGSGVTVDGTSVRVIGAGGESYERIYGAVPVPEASVRKVGGKRAAMTEKLKPALDQDGVQKHGWAALWKPLSKEIPAKVGDAEVQLMEKKNRLFGKITSDWK
ncbi:MAG: hypothetical protein P8R46_04495 [Planctomycetota bacterium]|nr:hypothetical protein [Planctomycetota bacterium]